MKHLSLITILFFLVSHFAFAQINKYGNAQITNYTVKDYHAYSQNWVSVTNQFGIMYFGNNSGVLEYDGVNWNLIPINNGAIVKSLAVDSTNTIYVGAENEFGFIHYNRNNIPVYTSLSDSLEESDQNFASIHKIYIEKEKVLFCANKKIFQYSNEKFDIIDLPKGGFFTHKVGNEYYMGDYYQGLMKLNNEKFDLCIGAEFYKEKDIMAAINSDSNEILFATSLNGLYFYNKHNGKSRLPESEAYLYLHDKLSTNFLYNAIKEDETYIFITLYGGAFICDNNFNIIEHYDKSSGINDEIILSCYISASNSYSSSLWLCLNNGISKIQTNSKFRKFNKLNGLEHEVLNITEFNGNIYLSTSNGVYFINNSNKFDSPEFIHVNKTEGQCWSFASMFDHLYVSSFDIYDIYKNSTKTIVPKSQVFKLLPSASTDNTLYAGTEKGLFIYKFQNNDLIFDSQIKGLNEHVFDIIESESGNLWISTKNNELIRIKIHENDTILTTFNENPHFSNIKSLLIFKYNNTTFFSTDKELLVYNENKNDFETQSFFKDDLYNLFLNIIHFAEDINGNLYVVKNDNNFHRLIVIKNKDGELFPDSAIAHELDEQIIISIYSDSDGILWIASNEGLYTYDIKKSIDYQKPYSALIRKIINNDSVLNITFKDNYSKRATHEFPYSNNSLTIQFAAPFFYYGE
jgi:hypothetical protein